jgi:pimeloyl-ACP methyl ester carboxylesterase
MSDLTKLKFIQTPVLNIGYEESGNVSGFPIILLHGFPYDIRSWDRVVPLLTEAGHRVLVPYLRGYGQPPFEIPRPLVWPSRLPLPRMWLTLPKR